LDAPPGGGGEELDAPPGGGGEELDAPPGGGGEELDAPPGGGGGARHCAPLFLAKRWIHCSRRQAGFLAPGCAASPARCAPSRLPRPPGPSGYLGLAPRLQWRDRAGIRPASLDGPLGRHGGGYFRAGPPNVSLIDRQGGTGRSVVSPCTVKCERSLRTIPFIPFIRATSSTLVNGRFVRRAMMARARPRPIPGSSRSSASLARFRFRTPVTALLIGAERRRPRRVSAPALSDSPAGSRPAERVPSTFASTPPLSERATPSGAASASAATTERIITARYSCASCAAMLN